VSSFVSCTRTIFSLQQLSRCYARWQPQHGQVFAYLKSNQQKEFAMFNFKINTVRSLLLILSLFVLIVTFLCQCSKSGKNSPSEKWDQTYFNPQPLADDFELPMPCGGAMVFRPVEIPSASTLDDRRIELGSADQRYGYMEGRRFGYIAGAFTDKRDKHDGDRRLFYISKYETTQDQYAAVMSKTCPRPSDEGQLPVVDVSWFDAVDFTRRYTEWLMQHAPNKLKSAGPEPGFLRLPTEEEWEFAARGGLKVDKADFVASVFPMQQGHLWDFVWYNSTQSAEGHLHRIGGLKPNPLGLYDILGNAAEMVFSPFHLDHRGRLHGQAGGFVVRGCSYLDYESDIRTSWRQEYDYFDNKTRKVNATDTIGFRLTLTAPVTTFASTNRLKEIEKDWSVLPALMGDVGKKANLALKDLQAMAQQAKDNDQRKKLEAIQGEIERAHAEIHEARNRTLRALIRSGAFLGNRVKTAAQIIESTKKAVALGENWFDALPPNKKKENREYYNRKKENWKRDLRKDQDNFEFILSYYGDMVIEVAGEYVYPEIQRQSKMVRAEFEIKHNDRLIEFARKFVYHIKQWQIQGKADKSAWIKDLRKEALK